MLKNYFKTAWRNLVRGKSFSIINISGLSVGMAGAILILLWIQHEVSFDKFHENKDRLYEVYGLTKMEGKLFAINATGQPLAPALKQDYPEVEATTRFSGVNSFLLTAGDNRLTGVEGNFADPSFLQMFNFPLAEGNKNDQLKNIYSIVITKKLAKKLFGSEQALNKTIKIDSTDNFIVTGVLDELPVNSRFDFEYLLPWDYLKKIGWNNDSWLSNNTSTFLLLKPKVNVTDFNNKIKNITRQKSGKNDVWTHFLFPLEKWHLYSEFENGIPSRGRIETVRLFGIIAAFILLIACINFMNLSTARSEKRAKEVGVRKVAGAGKGLLIGQFMIEAFLTASIAGIIAFLIVQITQPFFNTLIDAQLSVPYNSLNFWLYACGFILLTSLMAGSYPAFYLSSFKPISIFKKQFRQVNAAISPRKVLVVLQFTFAVILIISTIVIRNQVDYAQNRSTGYSKNNLIHVDFVGDIEKNYALIKHDLVSSGIASSVTKTMSTITQIGTNTWGLRWLGRNAEFDAPIGLFSTDADLIKTTGLQLAEGRDIDIHKYPTDSFEVMLNETAVKTMGFKDPIGQIITQPVSKKTWHVVGVVKDYVIGSPYQKIPPVVIEGSASWFSTMHVKFNTSQSTSESLAKAEQIFKKYNPAYPFDYQFVDLEYAKKFDKEQRTKTMTGVFATLAIFISCLGLFGLSAYIAESRVKEIGVRKVLGASVLDITRLLSIDFVKLVIVSIIIATPIAWYGMNKWLEDYSYRINVGSGIFIVAGLLAILIALITVSFQSIKTAVANPIKSLRTE